MRKAYAYVAGMSDDLDTPTVNADQIISIRVPIELNEKTESAARATGLKKADVIRLSLDRGIDRLLEQLEAKPQQEEA